MRWLAIGLVLLLGAASCSTSTVDGEEESATVTSSISGTPVVDEPEEVTTTTLDLDIDLVPPGVLVWVHDLEPIDLHADDPDNIADAAAWVQQGLIEGLFGVDRAMAYYPELLAGAPTVSQLNSGTIVIEYRLRDGLVWSDGTPLTSADVAYTHDIIVEGCDVENDRSIIDSTNDGCEYDMFSRIGYELVTDFEVVSPTEFKVTMAAFFPGWRDLYSRVFAAHAFGQNAVEVNANLRGWSAGGNVLPSSGPLVFEDWNRGRTLDLRRNDQYHGSVSPDAVSAEVSIDGVQLLFIAGLDARMRVLLDGRAHMMMAPLDPALAPLSADEMVVTSAIGGPIFEHLGLNLLNPHLAKPEVREAIAYSIDKSEIVSSLYEPLVGPVLAEAGLGSTYWMASQAGYRDHQSKYVGANGDAATASLGAAGYVRGADGTWSHPDVGQLRLRAGTTGGDPLREQQLELVQEQLGRAGIEVTIENAPGGLFFTDGPFSPDALAASASDGRSGNPRLWDIAQFSWSSGPWPGAVSGIYLGGSSSNPYGFDNPAFDVAAAECDGTVDDAERSGCYDQLDSYVTTLDNGDDGLFMIPLTQKPLLFAASNAGLTGVGVTTDLRSGGPLINIADYQLIG